MNQVFLPKNYTEKLDLYQTQLAIGMLRQYFQQKLCKKLNLKRVTAPLFVQPETGLNDDLNGIERAVSFDVKATGTNVQVVHSLAKWKRMALYEYKFPVGDGLYTDMNAIRRDEDLDNFHSIYVDQWDWEKVITRGDRTREYLEKTVQDIVDAICDTAEMIKIEFPTVDVKLNRKVKFITTQELEDLYPELTPKQRENAITKEYGTVFLMCIGDKLKSGNRHDGRAPDYDDWALNGDILFYNEVMDCALEISSMGIRVDEKSLDEQLNKTQCNHRRELPFHKMLLNGQLPLSIGGGIGQSRLCMLILQKAHIGQVQVSVWDDETKKICKENSITLL
ncbi:MAG: aspartate--ammonia ligase [Clostridiales bacterium]|nr:aspartate--ammonia ligase [Clostridiales bacterium]